MSIQKLKEDIKQVTQVQIYNEAQRDMIKEFGIFITYFIFWFPKYDKWYQNRIKQIECVLHKSGTAKDSKEKK